MNNFNWKAFWFCLLCHVVVGGMTTAILAPTITDFITRMLFWISGGISFGIALNSCCIIFQPEKLKDLKTVVQQFQEQNPPPAIPVPPEELTPEQAHKRLDEIKLVLEAIGSGELVPTTFKEDMGPGCWTMRQGFIYAKTGKEITEHEFLSLHRN